MFSSEQHKPHGVVFDDGIQCRRQTPVVFKIFLGKTNALNTCCGGLLAKHKQPCTVIIRKGLEQDTVNRGEDRCVGANAQRQHKNYRDAEPWSLNEGPEAKTEILDEVYDKPGATGIPTLFLDLFEASKILRRLESGLLGTHTALDVLFHLHFEMETHLFVEFHLYRWTANQRLQNPEQLREHIELQRFRSGRLQDFEDRACKPFPVFRFL